MKKAVGRLDQGGRWDASKSSGKEIDVALTPPQPHFPRRGPVLLTVGEPREGGARRPVQAHRGASVQKGGNALDRGNVC